MITLTPIELQTIAYAAIEHMLLYPECYKTGFIKAKEISKWIEEIHCNEPTKPIIMIDELPF